MANEAAAGATSERSGGSNLAVVKELFKNPVYGLFFLIVIVFEGVLVTAFLRAEGPIERMIALGAAVLLFAIVLVCFTIERGRHFGLEHARVAAAPKNMIADPVSNEAIEDAPDLLTAPDGTFVYGEPPANWKVTFPTFFEQASAELGGQGLGEADPETLLPFRPGQLVVFTDCVRVTIGFLPGKSLINGRPAIAMLTEEGSNKVIMFSVSKSGALMRQVSAEHVFVQCLASLVMSGAKVEEISEASARLGGRRTLSARATKRFDHITLDGIETAHVVVDLNLHLVEHENFLYVIETTLLGGGPATETHRAEIAKIVGSFRAAQAANGAEREQQDIKESDAAFARAISVIAPGLFRLKLNSLLDSMRKSGGAPLVTAGQVEALATLKASGEASPDLIPESLRKELADIHARARDALKGKPQALAELLGHVGDQAVAAAPSTPAFLGTNE